MYKRSRYLFFTLSDFQYSQTVRYNSYLFFGLLPPTIRFVFRNPAFFYFRTYTTWIENAVEVEEYGTLSGSALSRTRSSGSDRKPTRTYARVRRPSNQKRFVLRKRTTRRDRRTRNNRFLWVGLGDNEFLVEIARTTID